MPLRVVPSSTGLPSKRFPGIGFFSRAYRKIGVFQHVVPPTRLRLEFPRETGLILRFAGNVGNPLQTKQGNRSTGHDQKGRRGSDEVVPGPSVFPSRHPACRRTFAVSSRVSSTVSHLRTEHGTSLETPGISVFPWSETGMLGNFGVASRVPSSISNFKMERGTSLETLAGKGLILQ